MLDPANFHPAVMVPIAVASLATIAGLLMLLDTTTTDRRLHLADVRSGVLLTARLTTVALAALLATAVSLGSPRQSSTPTSGPSTGWQAC